ncbi:DsbA family oxidoreductase [Microbulbifer harenosus]|uniref:DsbA family oxidoreductase n=1 Tax=Microbulbifer harenosus TaxID=2576840 RepID=A0ABY2UHX4_9GAMM|nr:DsbA family oxidoreductase [Microbulbifer harenosus]TLM77340.1 DsbA family oxidoreductase [Microbulbifer harenosus]
MIRLNIHIYFDLICPWCFIGKRNLEAALETLAALHPQVQPELHWQPTQLLPDLPDHGVPFVEFYQHRLGSAEAVRLRQAQVQQATAQAGVSIAFDRIRVMPNTTQALGLLTLAEQEGSSAQYSLLLDQLFRAHFQQGKNIGDRNTLLEIARDSHFMDAVSERALAMAIHFNRSMSPSKAHDVPYFVFNNRRAVSGAAEPDTLVAAIRAALAATADTEEFS